ncbi:hypothetical protein DFH29DRAFT_956265 [Suillus ampliporus]|nr:hypothetical protein DFH29DRAFT_956265 [Suillus ampliporus]
MSLQTLLIFIIDVCSTAVLTLECSNAHLTTFTVLAVYTLRVRTAWRYFEIKCCMQCYSSWVSLLSFIPSTLSMHS